MPVICTGVINEIISILEKLYENTLNSRLYIYVRIHEVIIFNNTETIDNIAGGELHRPARRVFSKRRVITLRFLSFQG